MIYAIIGSIVFILMFLYVYTRQPKDNRVSLLTCLLGLALGAIPVFFASFYFQIFSSAFITKHIGNSALKMFVEYFIFVAGSEELTKYLCGVLLSKKCKSRMDYIVVFVAVGTGFEIFESVMQIDDLSSLLIKGLLALHICLQIYMGSFYGKGKKLMALFVPWLIHGAYDFLLTFSTQASFDKNFGELGALFILVVAVAGITLLVSSFIHAHKVGKESKLKTELDTTTN